MMMLRYFIPVNEADDRQPPEGKHQMPFINIKIAGPDLTLEQTARRHHGVIDLMARVLRKKTELTSVLVEQAPASGWNIGKQALTVAAHLDAKVTAGTNTSEEKVRFIAEANGLLKDVLGSALPVASYVVIDEIPGDSWGYDGLTQADRALTKQPER